MKNQLMINVPSVSACADFCGSRRFCRTAIFNSYTKTCAISYEYTLNCRYNKNRYTDFDVRQSTSHLIQVACVTKCGEDYIHLKSLEGKRQLVKEVTKAGTRRRPKKQKVEHVTGKPQHGGMRRPPQVCFRTVERRYLHGGSFEEHVTSSLDECRCLCAATFRNLQLHRCQSLQWYEDGKCVLNKGSHFGKYDLVEDRRAIYQFITCDVQVDSECFEEISGYMMTNVAGGLEHDVSIEQCKCHCANSSLSDMTGSGNP
ncbi:unnamed protein product [Nippostrongylus brasiliensis]|uniref:Apple domain-containing protein n=1 Tax=Nippostrongylus brasiliensis TaxID=27835 RepID=A0A158R0A2_NIPBR|nr:unnamed protein product [Nippostrongylus brasiliensis]